MAQTPDQLQDAAKIFAEQLRANQRPPADLGSGSSFLKGLSNSADLASGALKGLVEGNVKFGDAVGGAGQAIGKFGSIAKTGGDALSYMGKYAQESVDAMRNFGKIGAGFNGDAIGMRSSIAQTRMSLDEYGKFLNKNTSILNAMGGSVTQGTTKFNEFSQAFFDQQAKQGDAFGSVSDQLRNLGMTSEEINGTLAIELASRRFQNMEDTKTRDEAIASAANMATEMDKIAKLTGKSREQQQAELAALEKDGQYQAAIRLAMRDGNQFAAKGMQEAMTSMGKFGQPVQNLVKDFLAFGTASKETQDTLAALGPAGTELQNAIQMVKSAKTEEQKIAAQAALKRAEESVTAEVNSRRVLENAALGIKGFKGIADSTTTVTAGMDKVAAENKLNLDLEVDRRKAAQILNEQAKKEQTTATKAATEGGADAGKATTQAVVQFEKVMQNSTAAIQEQFINRLNTEIAPGMIEFTKFLKAPGLSRERQAGRIAETYDTIKETFKGGGPGSAEGTQAAAEQARQRALAEGKSKEEADRAARQEESRLRPRPNQPAAGNETVPVRVVNTDDFPNAGRRFGGTIGMTGKLFETPGLVEIDRTDESVMTSEHIMNLAKGSQVSGVKSALDKLTQSVNPNSFSTGFKMPQVDLSQLKIPKIDVPKIDAPKFEIPKIDASQIKIPKIDSPKFDASKFDIPKFEIPKIDASQIKIPKIDLPKTDMRSEVKGTVTENGKTREMSQADLKKATDDMSKMMGNIDFSQISKNFSTQISSTTSNIKEGLVSTISGIDFAELATPFAKSFEELAVPAAEQTTNVSASKELGVPAAGSNLTQLASSEKLAQDQALEAKKKQAEDSIKSAKLYKDSSEKFVSFLEKDIAAKEQELASTDSERTKRRLEKELADQRTKLVGAKEQVLEDSKDLLSAEKELQSLQEAAILKENELHAAAVEQVEAISSQTESLLTSKLDLADAEQSAISTEMETQNEIFQATKSIAEQTQPLLAAKKSLSDSELVALSTELSSLDNKKRSQDMREQNAKLDLQILNADKGLLENSQQLAIKDLQETDDAIAIIRSRIDTASTEEEVTALQKELAEEESAKSAIERNIAAREKDLLSVASDIALKEQELQDIREEAADTEFAIQEKRNELLEAVVSANESQIDDMSKFEIPEQEPFDEFAGVDEAVNQQRTIAKNTTGMDVQAEDGSISQGIKINPETGETYSTDIPKTEVTAAEPKSSTAYSSMLDKFFGPMASPNKATAGVDAAKGAAVKEAEKKEADSRQQASKSQADKQVTTEATKSATTTSGTSKEASLSDVVKSLDILNKQVGQLNSEMSKLPNLMEKAVSATKSLNGNLNMRA